MTNYNIRSCNPKDAEHSSETRFASISDLKIGDYLTDHYDMDGQMFSLDLYAITKISDKSVTIEKFIFDGRGLHKPIRLSWVESKATWCNGHLSNKRHNCYFTKFIKNEELDTTYLKLL